MSAVPSQEVLEALKDVFGSSLRGGSGAIVGKWLEDLKDSAYRAAIATEDNDIRLHKLLGQNQMLQYILDIIEQSQSNK